MGVLARSQASLRVFGDDLDPADISQLLGAAPTKSALKGSEKICLISGKTRTAKTGSWHLSAVETAPENLNTQVVEILSCLTTDLEVWQQLSRDYQLDMYCGLFMGHWNDGMSLSVDTMLALGQRGIALNFDIYQSDKADD